MLLKKERVQRILFLLEDFNLFYSREAVKLLNSGFSYNDAIIDLVERRFYQSDSMAFAFSSLGYQTEIVVPEANPLQLTWAKENRPLLFLRWKLEAPLRSIKSRVFRKHRTSFNSIQFAVLMEQVRLAKPDVIYFYSNIYITRRQLRKLRSVASKIVLQWTCPLWREQPEYPYDAFDLIVTASIQLKDYFQSKNLKVVYIQQAFDHRIVAQLKEEREIKGDVVFIGGFSLGHHYRAEILESLLQNGVDLTVHGTGREYLTDGTLLKTKLLPPLFGVEMYEEYRKYRIAIHVHTTGHQGDGFEWQRFAGAKRLFEITGSGSLLMTTDQENVKDLFVVCEEVVTYTSAEDLFKKITLLLSEPKKIDQISLAGQRRTLQDHTFINRAKELEKFLVNNS